MIEIKDKKACCGCSACVQICPRKCIRMAADDEGFEYPVVNPTDCISCGLCERVCPMLYREDAPKRPLKVYATKNLDERVREASSSGAMFTPLAESVLRRNGVVFGARFDKEWNVEHAYVEDCSGLSDFRGSKYVQSRIGVSYTQVKKFLQSGREVLFSGTPCQIAGLNRFLGKEYPNLVTVEILCHGVPSVKVWQRFLDCKKREYHCNGITQINFRNKKTGWSKYSITIEFENGKVYEAVHKRDMYFRGFLKDIYLRPSCYECKCKNGRAGSDLIIADYWNIKNILPEYNDNRGVSSVLVNTDKGLSLFESVSEKIDLVETGYDECITGNKGFSEQVTVPENRKKFFKDLADSRQKMKFPVSVGWWKKMIARLSGFIH